MLTLREDIAELMERLDESVATADSLPHRSKYLLLVIDFLRDYLTLHLDLVETVEREFAVSAGDQAREQAASAEV
jgi:hypothetical protein